jgi:hypothetical protein
VHHAPIFIFALTLIVYHTVAGYDQRSEISDCSADGRRGAPLRNYFTAFGFFFFFFFFLQLLVFDINYRRTSISGTKKAKITFPLRQFFPLKVVK